MQRAGGTTALGVEAELRVEAGSFTARRISPIPIAAAGLTLHARGELDRDARGSELGRLDGELHEGDARVTLAASLHRDDADAPSLAVSLGLPKSDCAKLLIALPPPCVARSTAWRSRVTLVDGSTSCCR